MRKISEKSLKPFPCRNDADELAIPTDEIFLIVRHENGFPEPKTLHRMQSAANLAFLIVRIQLVCHLNSLKGPVPMFDNKVTLRVIRVMLII